MMNMMMIMMVMVIGDDLTNLDDAAYLFTFLAHKNIALKDLIVFYMRQRRIHSVIEVLRTGDNQAFATLIKVTPHLNFFSKGTCYYGKEAPYVPQVGI